MEEFQELSGPAHDPVSGGPARQLVILCHGVGSDGHDLIGLAPYYAKVLPDAKFIQALIQLSVGYFHITNNNRNGANGLLKKCVPKFKMYLPIKRGIDVGAILDQVSASLENLKSIDNICDFNWDLVKKININNE